MHHAETFLFKSRSLLSAGNQEHRFCLLPFGKSRIAHSPALFPEKKLRTTKRRNKDTGKGTGKTRGRFFCLAARQGNRFFVFLISLFKAHEKRPQSRSFGNPFRPSDPNPTEGGAEQRAEKRSILFSSQAASSAASGA